MIITTLWSLLMKNYLIYKELDDHDEPLEPLDQKLPDLQYKEFDDHNNPLEPIDEKLPDLQGV
jgi:hypothetical protein